MVASVHDKTQLPAETVFKLFSRINAADETRRIKARGGPSCSQIIRWLLVFSIIDKQSGISCFNSLFNGTG